MASWKHVEKILVLQPFSYLLLMLQAILVGELGVYFLKKILFYKLMFITFLQFSFRGIQWPVHFTTLFQFAVNHYIYFQLQVKKQGKCKDIYALPHTKCLCTCFIKRSLEVARLLSVCQPHDCLTDSLSLFSRVYRNLDAHVDCLFQLCRRLYG